MNIWQPTQYGEKVLHSATNDTSLLIPSAALSQATSVEIPGLVVQFTQPANPVEVRIDGNIQFTAAGVAAATRVQVAIYLYDMVAAPANFAPTNAWANGLVKHVFHDATQNQQAQLAVSCVDLFTSTTGTLQQIMGRVYIALGAAATWTATLLNSSSRMTMKAIEEQ
jgi:hypothetical protein